MSGTNTPVTVVLADQSQMESRIFKELTQGGAKTLGAAQAGIYSGDEYLIKKGRQEEIPALEDELNRLYLEASIPRMDYFKKVKINGAGNIKHNLFLRDQCQCAGSAFFRIVCGWFPSSME